MNPDFRDLLQCFNDEKVDYLIVGGYAVMVYAEPRLVARVHDQTCAADH